MWALRRSVNPPLRIQIYCSLSSQTCCAELVTPNGCLKRGSETCHPGQSTYNNILSSPKRFYQSLSSNPKFSVRNCGLSSQAYHQSVSFFNKNLSPSLCKGSMMGPVAVGPNFTTRGMTTVNSDESTVTPDAAPRIKFKRLDKTAGHIMKILDKEAVEEVRAQREIPEIKPGYTIQLKVEVPENKRRVSTFKGTVIARRNAGLNSTFRLRRMVAGVGVESVYPLYSPNIKEIKVLEKKRVRRAKLYYIRDRMNALK